MRLPTLLVALTVVGGCGANAGAPSSSIPNPFSPGPANLQTTVRVVSALSPQAGVPQAKLTLANGREKETDAAGMSALTAQSPSVVPLVLRHPAFHQRETSVRIPADGAIDLSLIPATHDLTAFEEFSPRTGGLQRWTRNPRLMVLTHAVDYSGATLGFREYPVMDRPINPTQLDCLASGLAAKLAEMSGGHLSWDSVEIASVQPGTRFRTDATPEGTIVVLPSVSLGASGRGIAYVGSEAFVLSRGAVWLTDNQNFCFTSLLYLHELGHALGYMHVTRTLSIMSPGGLPAAPTVFDRDSIAILFQRRPGNRMPDRDLPGLPNTVTGSAARRDVEPMR